MKFTAQQIAEVLGGQVEGDPNVYVCRLSKIEEGYEGSITFLANPRYSSYLHTTKASVVIVNIDFELEKPISTTLIRVEDPYKGFSDLLNYYQQLKKSKKQGIEQPSYLSPTAKYSSDLYLGAFSYVGDNVVIGNNVKIFPQSFIGDDVVIGDDVIIYSGVHIYSDVTIGHRCQINSSCVIGADGFGFVPDKDKVYSKIPQLGKVIIEDDVDLGACVTIDRSTLGATIIKKGVKLDNHVHVGHNVTIEENTVIAAQAGIAGSTKVGKECVIGGQVGIAGHIKIADNTSIQAQSGVIKTSKEGAIIQGSPAFDHRAYNKSYVYFRKLPKIIEDLETRIKQG